VVRIGEFEVRSRLDASPAEVWERIITPAGINDELMPICRMTLPRGLRRLDPAEIELGTPLGRSWIMLFGLIPIDYDNIILVRLEPGKGFLERSAMLSQSVWEHERTIEPQGPDACNLTDRVRFQPRLPIPSVLLRPLFRAVFRHRHRRLRAHFGGVDAEPA
jgi:ligand-binding SRPBCC domain-containing protein